MLGRVLRDLLCLLHIVMVLATNKERHLDCRYTSVFCGAITHSWLIYQGAEGQYPWEELTYEKNDEVSDNDGCG